MTTIYQKTKGLQDTELHYCPGCAHKKHQASSRWGKPGKNCLTRELDACFRPVFPAPQTVILYHSRKLPGWQACLHCPSIFGIMEDGFLYDPERRNSYELWKDRNREKDCCCRFQPQ